MGIFVVNALITVIIYSVPVYAYKNARDKEIYVPMSRALTIAISYTVFAFIVVSVIKYLLGGVPSAFPAFFWGFVNYKILRTGAAEIEAQEAAPTEPAQREMSMLSYQPEDKGDKNE